MSESREQADKFGIKAMTIEAADSRLAELRKQAKTKGLTISECAEFDAMRLRRYGQSR